MERIKTGQMRKRRRLFRWGLIAAVNAGALAILFFVFLWFTDAYIERQSKSTFIYDIHSLRRQNLIPNQVYEHGGVRITINEHGVRGRAPQMPKPEVVCRIATMGGSSVFDHLLGDGESWPERLAARRHPKCQREELVAFVMMLSTLSDVLFGGGFDSLDRDANA